MNFESNQTMSRVGIVADDLTSAMDGAAPFVVHGDGCRASVVVGGRTACRRADLIAVDTDSRSRTPEEAALLTSRAITQLRAAPVLMKTVDSTLRGHILVELEAAWRASGRRLVVFAPAFPASGRTTRNGIQLVHGLDVAQSAFGNDARHPSPSGRIASLLAPLAAELVRVNGDLPTEGVIIGDAECDEDLDRLVAAAAVDEVLWVGSPGLAAAVARRHSAASGIDRSAVPAVRRVVVVIGSTHRVNAMQLARLRQHVGDGLRFVGEDGDAGDATIAVIMPPPAVGRVPIDAAVRVKTMLADRTRALVGVGFDGLIVTGGETARSTVASLDIQQIDVLDEPWPGVVVGYVPQRSITIATKAGGFGGHNTLVDLVEYLVRGRRR